MIGPEPEWLIRGCVPEFRLKKKAPADPWGNKYIYKAPGEHGEFDLSSFGRDGKLGGADEDADITTW